MKKRQQENQINNSTGQIKALGCGQAMNFSILPRLPDIEQRLAEWFQVDTF